VCAQGNLQLYLFVVADDDDDNFDCLERGRQASSGKGMKESSN